MKKTYEWLLFSGMVLLCSHNIQSQTLAEWPLSPSHTGNGSSTSQAIDVFDLERGNGLSRLTFSGSGVSASNWASQFEVDGAADYFEFGVRIDQQRTAHITKLAFNEKRSSDGPRMLDVYYSLDGFATRVHLAQIALPDNFFTREHALPIDLKFNHGKALTFRIYAHQSESSSGSWSILGNSLELQGEVLPDCDPPGDAPEILATNIQPTSVQINLTGGQGSHSLVVVSEAGSNMPYPLQGEIYTGSNVFGAGEALDSKTHIVHVSNAGNDACIISNLRPGKTYHAAAFSFNAGELCYGYAPRKISFTTSCGNLGGRVPESVKYSALDALVAIDWKEPGCYDKFLVLAAEQPFTGRPTELIFNDANEEFGTSTPVASMAGTVYPVFYAGNASRAVVEGLTNGRNYHFAVYTRMNGQWSDGVFFQARPEAACRRAYYERIFINEIHYQNMTVEQDEGVEIAGPAGIDLGNYELVVQEGVSRLNSIYREVARLPLSGAIDDEGNGYGAIWIPVPGMPNNLGRVVLRNTVHDEEVEVITYDMQTGIRDAFSAPTQPVGPGNQGISEAPNDPVGYALQRIGDGVCAADFTWAKLPHSRGMLNLGQAALPVELAFLAAEAKGQTARVYWQTLTEVNSDFFIVEHSSNGRDFKMLAEIKAAGTSLEPLDYELVHTQPEAGVNYYRLKQVDFDGTVHDHGLVSVTFKDGLQPGLTVFPNPTDDLATVSWTGSAETLHLVSTTGQILQTFPLDAASSSGSRQLDLASLPQGLYYVQLVGPEQAASFGLYKR